MIFQNTPMKLGVARSAFDVLILIEPKNALYARSQNNHIFTCRRGWVSANPAPCTPQPQPDVRLQDVRAGGLQHRHCCCNYSACAASRRFSTFTEPHDDVHLTAALRFHTRAISAPRLALALACVASASAFVAAPRAGRATARMAADLDSMVGVGPESGNKVWVSKGWGPPETR